MRPRKPPAPAVLASALLVLAGGWGGGAGASDVPDPCGELAPGLRRDSCVRKAARATRDPALCEAIENVDWRVLCVVGLDPRPEHAKRCPEMTRDREACWKHLAYVLEDESYCREIEHAGTRDYCTAHVAVRRDASDPCNRFDGLSERARCYEERAEAEANPSLCSRVGQWNFDDGCSDVVYATGAYGEFGPADTSNATDGLAGDPASEGTLLALTSAETAAGTGTQALINLGIA